MTNIATIAIPVGTTITFCRACRNPIYFVPVPGASSLKAVDARVEGGYPPSHVDEGRGAPHAQTCPKAGELRQQRRPVQGQEG